MKNKEELLIACVVLNLVEELDSFKEYQELEGETDTYQAVLRYVEDELYGEVGFKTLEKIYFGMPTSTTAYISQKSYNAIMKNEEFYELAENTCQAIQENDSKTMDKVTNIIEKRIENKEFPKLLESMKKDSSRHFALPTLLKNKSLLTKVLEYLPLVEKIFESEENIEIFSQVANRLDTFRIAEEYEDWGNIESFIKDVRERNGFDNYLK